MDHVALGREWLARVRGVFGTCVWIGSFPFFIFFISIGFSSSSSSFLLLFSLGGLLLLLLCKFGKTRGLIGVCLC